MTRHPVQSGWGKEAANPQKLIQPQKSEPSSLCPWDPASCSLFCTHRTNKSSETERAQVHFHRARETCLLFVEYIHHSACPVFPHLPEPSKSGFPKSLPPRLLPSAAWPLPALSRFCSDEQRQGQFADKWFWGRDQLLALKAEDGIQAWVKQLSQTMRAGPRLVLFLNRNKKPGLGSCQGWASEPQDCPTTSPQGWHEVRTGVCLGFLVSVLEPAKFKESGS